MAWGEEDGNDGSSFFMSDGVGIVVFLAGALGMIHLFDCCANSHGFMEESEVFESQEFHQK